jgi:hypothetical protein
MAELNGTIDAQVPAGMDADIAQDLHNSVDNIARTLSASPTADVGNLVAALRNKIQVRSTEQDAEGNPRMSAAARDALLAAVTQLEAALAARPA